MLDKKYLDKIKKNLLDYAETRREVIKTSGDALHYSKRIIFSLHKNDKKSALEYEKKAEQLFLLLDKKYKKEPRVFSEGSYKAALEEYTEAKLFLSFIKGGAIGDVSKKIKIEPEVYIGGLADVPGEIYRYAVKAATEHKNDLVKKCLSVSEKIIESLFDMNLTGYSRQKFDQAKTAHSKLEQIVYDLSLRE